MPWLAHCVHKYSPHTRLSVEFTFHSAVCGLARRLTSVCVCVCVCVGILHNRWLVHRGVLERGSTVPALPKYVTVNQPLLVKEDDCFLRFLLSLYSSRSSHTAHDTLLKTPATWLPRSHSASHSLTRSHEIRHAHVSRSSNSHLAPAAALDRLMRHHRTAAAPGLRVHRRSTRISGELSEMRVRGQCVDGQCVGER
jgi:hypothetical protein